MTTLVPVCGLWVEHNQCKSCETWQCTAATWCPCRCYDQVSPSQSTTECLRRNTDAHILYLTCLSYCVCVHICVLSSLSCPRSGALATRSLSHSERHPSSTLYSSVGSRLCCNMSIISYAGISVSEACRTPRILLTTPLHLPSSF